MGRLNYQVGDRINPFYAVPVGTILPFAGSSIPAGWLECAGQVLSRATYPDLFAAIGTTYGAATSETFNLPDLRGEFLRGWDNGKGVDPGRALGSAQGWNAPKEPGYRINNISSGLNFANGPYVSGHLVTDATFLTGNSNETRPRNVAVRFCIRAFGSIENSGLIDVGALAVEVSDAVKIGDFIGGNQSKTGSGYQKLPGGLIIQWGTNNALAAEGTINFPVSFTTACLSISNVRQAASITAGVVFSINAGGPISFNWYCSSAGSSTFKWIAIGH